MDDSQRVMIALEFNSKPERRQMIQGFPNAKVLFKYNS